MKVRSESEEVAQSCPTLSNPMDCSLPGSSIHGIFQARVLEWVAIAFSKRPSSSSVLSANRVVSSAYLRLLVFLLAYLDSSLWISSLAFFMMYSAYKLKKSRVTIYSFDMLLSQFWTSPLAMFSSKCCFFLLHTGFSGERWGLVFPSLRIFYSLLWATRASLVAQLIKNLPAMRETWVQSLGCEDPLEKGIVTHSSILVWRIPWTI